MFLIPAFIYIEFNPLFFIIRFEYRDHIQRSFTSCSDVIRKNPLCGRNITVSYSNHPPYINVGHDGDIEGILPGKISPLSKQRGK